MGNKRFTRSRNGCWTCKLRKRKCDEGKPSCNNCLNSGRECQGYKVLLAFDIDSSRFKEPGSGTSIGFRGRPPLHSSLAARGVAMTRSMPDKKKVKRKKNGHTFVYIDGKTMKKHTDNNVTRECSEINTANPVGTPVEQPISTTLVPQKQLETVLVFEEKYNECKDNHEVSDLRDPIVFMDDLMLNLDSISPFAWSPSSSNTENIETRFVKDDEYFVKYFMNNLLPMLDTLDKSPFPGLVLRYCDSKLAKSCFVSLSSIHLYGIDKNFSDYHQSIEQLDIITNDLLSLFKIDESISGNGSIGPVELIADKLSSLPNKARISKVLTILIIIYVHTMFSIVESGRSAISEFLFNVGSTITYDLVFRDIIAQDEQVKFLVTLLGWFDAFTALCSPKPRRSHIRKYWFNGQNELRLKCDYITGCPETIFSCLLDILDLRCQLSDFSEEELLLKKQEISNSLLNYRNDIEFNTEWTDSQFLDKLHAAQCWCLGSLVYLNQLLPGNNSTNSNAALAKEFLFIFGQLSDNSKVKSQLVWPLFMIGQIVGTVEDQNFVIDSFSRLYESNRMGNMTTLQAILKEVWTEKKTVNTILSEVGWSKSGISLLAF